MFSPTQHVSDFSRPNNWRVESLGLAERDFESLAAAIFVATANTIDGHPSFVKDIANGWAVWPDAATFHATFPNA